VSEPAADALQVEHVAKRFGAVVALRDVSLRLKQGEVLALVGDNGAGKSTLIKILTGFQQPDQGRILVDGNEVRLRSVSHARSLGIDTVYQDLALVPGLSVFHNMFLNRELTHGIGPLRWLDNGEMRKRARQYLDNIGIGTLRSVDSEVALLSGGQRQAIALAVKYKAKIVYDASRRAGMDPPVCSHRLRHALATNMLAAGVRLPDIGQVLRHRDLATTAVYAKVDHTALRELAIAWPQTAVSS